ncbi:hypothetical protein ACUV84_001311 [Puccinellia chinampoensis]
MSSSTGPLPVRVGDEAENKVSVELDLREGEGATEVGGAKAKRAPTAALVRKASAAWSIRSPTERVA